MSRKRILITGGAGFIGQHISARLVSKGYQVSVYDIRSYPENKLFVQGDIFNNNKLANVITNVDIIVHMIGLADARVAQENPSLSFKLNVSSLQNVLEVCRSFANKRIIFPSTAAIYGVPRALPVGENEELKPGNVYGWHKYICEKLIQMYHDNYGVEYVILRLFNTYGKGNRGVIYSFLERARRGEDIQVYGAEQYRDFVYVGDVVDAFYKCISRQQAGKKIINVGSGRGIQIKEIANIIADMYPNINVTMKKSNLAEYDSIAEISLAKSLLNFRPHTSTSFLKRIIKSEMVD